MTSEEKSRVVAAVADLRERFEIPVQPGHRGPVLLARFFDECNLLHVERPALTRASVYDYLLSEGFIPGDLGEDEALAGFLFLTPSAGFVFVNGSEPVPRRRFTAAHELGHFALHRNQMGGLMSIGDTPAMVVEVEREKIAEMERQANRFAAVLLMPTAVCIARAEEFKKAYRVCPLQPFAYHLAAELLVSPEAMRYRLQELGVCDE